MQFKQLYTFLTPNSLTILYVCDWFSFKADHIISTLERCNLPLSTSYNCVLMRCPAFGPKLGNQGVFVHTQYLWEICSKYKAVRLGNETKSVLPTNVLFWLIICAYPVLCYRPLVQFSTMFIFSYVCSVAGRNVVTQSGCRILYCQPTFAVEFRHYLEMQQFD